MTWHKVTQRESYMAERELLCFLQRVLVVDGENQVSQCYTVTDTNIQRVRL